MNEEVDTGTASEACAREPIQYPGAIQPHGYLVSCVMPDWTIRHVSANAGELFEVPVESLPGQSLREYVSEQILRPVADIANLAEPGATPLRVLTANIGPSAGLFDVSVHVDDGLVHLEFESRPHGSRDGAPSAIAQAMIARVASEDRIEGVYQRAVEQLRTLIGFDRVLVYRFRADGAGEVIAEARADDIPPLMGLRFPESDIPAQARALYVRNRIRVIPDTAYAPVPILPPLAADGAPLDLGMHLLRSVSPVHLEYSRNMGVAASMSISLVSVGKLWGLIACHHRTPRAVPAALRAAAELFGLFLSMRVSAHEQDEAAIREEFARDVREGLWRKLASTRDLDLALTDEMPQLAMSMNCDGVAILHGGRWYATGHVPDAACAPILQAWLDSDGKHREDILSTNRADGWCAADCGVEHIAGLLALRLGRQDDWLLFFRNEQVEEVSWAGEPVKAAGTVNGHAMLRPRERFEAWREVIRGCSLPWSDLDLRTAQRLRQLLNEFRARAIIAGADFAVEYEATLRRNTLRDQRARLEQLSHLFEGLVHLDEADTARLSERISLLEAELRALVATAPTRIGEPKQ